LEAPFSILSLEDLDSDLTSFSNNLGESFKQWGFCGIKNHGVDTELVTQVQEMFIQFFSFSEEKKKKNILDLNTEERGVIRLFRLKRLRMQM
jgi:isopenicillin N synthase-like dioxygenase